MKNQKLSIILLLGIQVSCSKPERVATSHLIEVFELKTSTPLASVQIQFLRCSDYDIQFGCQRTEIFAYGNTDDKGRYSVSQLQSRRADQGIKLSKAKYWYTDGHTGINYMAPEGWINIHLIRQNVYSFPRLYFGYYLPGKTGDNIIYTRINPITVPFDTIITIRAFGNQVNNVKWQIGSGSVISYVDYNISNVSPVLAEGILTQNPGKFDSTSVTLLY